MSKNAEQCCKSPRIVNQSGCFVCMNCGWSVCG